MDSTLYYFGLGCLVLALVAMASRVLFDRREIYKFPTLAAILGLAWVVPQAIAIESLRVNDYATEGFWLYVAACFVFIAIGFRIGRWAYDRRRELSPGLTLPDYDVDRLSLACLGLAAIGWTSLFLLRGMNLEELGSQWTGQAAFLVLLGKSSGLALCLSVLAYARTRSRAALVIAILVALPMLQTALVGVRRELLFDIVLLSVGVWLFAKNRFPPRAAIIAAALVGTIVINSAGNLRAYVSSGEGTLLSALTSTETYANFSYFERGEGEASELRQAQFDHWSVSQISSYQYGAGYWNGLVQLYVPAFIMGRDFKEGLKISNSYTENFGRGRNELYFHGSTRTGFADSYSNFGPLGVLAFLLIGYFFGFLYSNAIIGGLAGQFLYFSMLAEGLKAITHSTAEFLAALPFALILALVALQFAKVRDRRSRSAKSATRAPGVNGAGSLSR